MNRYWVKIGLKVVTVSNLPSAKSLGIAKEHHNVRKPNKEGVVEARAAADGGYLWWVKHNDNTLGIYGCDEFNPAEGYFYAIDYAWIDGETLKIGRIISSKSEILETEVRKLTKEEPCSISAIKGPFETEADAQTVSLSFFATEDSNREFEKSSRFLFV